jgi:hypothetical protein
MFQVRVVIFSNKCGCGLTRRKKRKLLYIGADQEAFEQRINGFVSDEYHRYAVEYAFDVQCVKSRVISVGPHGPMSSKENAAPIAWPELCYMFDQVVNFPVSSGTAEPTAASPYEYARVLLVDEEEQGVLLTALYRLARTNDRRGGAEDAGGIVVTSALKDSSAPVVIRTVNKRDDRDTAYSASSSSTSSIKYLETNPSVYKKCRERIMELDRVKDDYSSL